MTYDQLRARCIRYWHMHPETKGSIAELWDAVNSRGSGARSMAEQSATMLFSDLAVFIDNAQSAAGEGSDA